MFLRPLNFLRHSLQSLTPLTNWKKLSVIKTVFFFILCTFFQHLYSILPDYLGFSRCLLFCGLFILGTFCITFFWTGFFRGARRFFLEPRQFLQILWSNLKNQRACFSLVTLGFPGVFCFVGGVCSSELSSSLSSSLDSSEELAGFFCWTRQVFFSHNYGINTNLLFDFLCLPWVFLVSSALPVAFYPHLHFLHHYLQN